MKLGSSGLPTSMIPLSEPRPEDHITTEAVTPFCDLVVFRCVFTSAVALTFARESVAPRPVLMSFDCCSVSVSKTMSAWSSAWNLIPLTKLSPHCWMKRSRSLLRQRSKVRLQRDLVADVVDRVRDEVRNEDVHRAARAAELVEQVEVRVRVDRPYLTVRPTSTLSSFAKSLCDATMLALKLLVMLVAW